MLSRKLVSVLESVLNKLISSCFKTVSIFGNSKFNLGAYLIKHVLEA